MNLRSTYPEAVYTLITNPPKIQLLDSTEKKISYKNEALILKCILEPKTIV